MPNGDIYQGWTLTLTGSEQDTCIQVLKSVPAFYQYFIGSEDVSDNMNRHQHVLLWMNKRVSKEKLIQDLCELDKSFISAIQYCENIKRLAGITNYIVNKQKEGFKLYGVGTIPATIQKKINDQEEDAKDSPFIMLCAQAYKNREECIMDFQARAAAKFIMSKATIMAAINEAYPIISTTPKYRMDQFNTPPLDFNDNKSKIIVGTTGLGKTQWAKAHFKNPLVVTDKESWSMFDVDVHDGIVIDDMTYEKNNPVQFLHMLDMREPLQKRVLYNLKIIPAEIPRIFTTNSQKLFWPETAAMETIKAYLSRCEVIVFADNSPSLFDKKKPAKLYRRCAINTNRLSTHPSGLDYDHVPYEDNVELNEIFDI